ncbi:MAG TPA: hypothetical protein PLL86_07285, partial [Leptospiraceae bacterium]|nr:hypothetical protein [Leptospiraceae bacterium]
MIKLPVKYTFYFKKNRQFLLGLIIIVLQLAINLSISSEPKSKRLRYQKNLKRVEEFKKNMSEPEKAYYLPRRRFIDKQSVKPSDDRFYQIDIILRGTALREKNKWNIRDSILSISSLLVELLNKLLKLFGILEPVHLPVSQKSTPSVASF